MPRIKCCCTVLTSSIYTALTVTTDVQELSLWLALAYLPNNLRTSLRFGKLFVEPLDQLVQAGLGQQPVPCQLIKSGFLDVNKVLPEVQELVFFERAAGCLEFLEFLAQLAPVLRQHGVKRLI